LPRSDALKVLPAHLTTDDNFRRRFNREAEVAAKLWHPHIVGIHDRGEYEGQLWISMDYVEGSDAAHLQASQFPSGMPAETALPIITAVAGALDYAHEQGLLHRDVKPANILISKPGTDSQRILLSDFGIARPMDEVSGLTATNVAVGTISYMPPEQLMGQKVDGRADQYALACTAFHLLLGAPPFKGTSPTAVIGQHLTEPPPQFRTQRPDLAGLDPTFQIALAKRPEDRFPRCSDFAQAVAKNLREPQIQVGPTEPNFATPPPPPPPPGNYQPQSVPPQGSYSPPSVPPQGSYQPAFAPPPSNYQPAFAPPPSNYQPPSAPPPSNYQPAFAPQGRSRVSVLVIIAIVAVVAVGLIAVVVILLSSGKDSETSASVRSSPSSTSAGRGESTTRTPTSRPTGPTSGPGAARVTVDGTDQNAGGTVDCTVSGGDQIISVGTGVTAIVTAGDSPHVKTVALSTGNNMALAYSEGMGQGDATATKSGNNYQISGHAIGVDLSNPTSGMQTRAFEIDVTCP
jgi:serine/threonine-protein kinase